MTGHPVLLAIALGFFTPASQRPADSCIIIQAAEQIKTSMVNLEIIVSDVVGDRVSGAIIQLRSGSDNKPLEYQTNGKGLVVAFLSPGDYKISVRSRGFKEWIKDRISSLEGPIR
jgi:hypothetical protein